MRPITSTDQMACSMVKTRHPRLLACLLSLVVAGWTATGCGTGGDTAEGSDGTRVLGPKETKQLLRQLPYRYTFRSVATPKGAEAAVAGRAIGRHHTRLNFGIALGHGHHGVPVPGAGTEESYGYPRGGFIFTDDVFVKGSDGHLEPNPNLHTAAQWNEATSMSVAMTDKLCLAATGEHCPP
jgi:hypothetical protein